MEAKSIVTVLEMLILSTRLSLVLNVPSDIVLLARSVGMSCATLGLSGDAGKNCLCVLGVLGILLFLMGGS